MANDPHSILWRGDDPKKPFAAKKSNVKGPARYWAGKAPKWGQEVEDDGELDLRTLRVAKLDKHQDRVQRLTRHNQGQKPGDKKVRHRPVESDDEDDNARQANADGRRPRTEAAVLDDDEDEGKGSAAGSLQGESRERVEACIVDENELEDELDKASIISEQSIGDVSVISAPGAQGREESEDEGEEDKDGRLERERRKFVEGAIIKIDEDKKEEEEGDEDEDDAAYDPLEEACAVVEEEHEMEVVDDYVPPPEPSSVGQEVEEDEEEKKTAAAATQDSEQAAGGGDEDEEMEEMEVMDEYVPPPDAGAASDEDEKKDVVNEDEVPTTPGEEDRRATEADAMREEKPSMVEGEKKEDEGVDEERKAEGERERDEDEGVDEERKADGAEEPALKEGGRERDEDEDEREKQEDEIRDEEEDDEELRRMRDEAHEEHEEKEEEEKRQEAVEEEPLEGEEEQAKAAQARAAVAEVNVRAVSDRLARLAKMKKEHRESTIHLGEALGDETDSEERNDRRAAARTQALVKRKMEEAKLEQLKKDQPSESEESESERQESESDSDDFGRVLQKPIFTPKSMRTTDEQKQAMELHEKRLAEDRKQALKLRAAESKAMVVEAIRKEEEEIKEEQAVLSDADMPDDEDGDEAEEYELWKIRELKRLKRSAQERQARKKEAAFIERRRNMTDAERAADDKRLDALKPKKEKGKKYSFMQKYYHKGGYYMDLAAEGKEKLYTRDTNEALAEEMYDKSSLPKVMQIRRGYWGKKGQVKHTHLSAVDTTSKDSLWANSAADRDLKQKRETKSRTFDRPSAK